MSKVDELLAAVQALKEQEAVEVAYLNDQSAKLAELSAKLDIANAALAAAGTTDPQIQEAIDAINGIVADMKAKVAPVVMGDQGAASEQAGESASSDQAAQS